MIAALALAAAAWLPGVGLSPPPDAIARPPAATQEGGDSLRLFLVTFGPGAQVWERFGHNALWIHDPDRGTDLAYHYGLFDMSEAGFLVEFLQGRMAYSMGSADAFRLIDAYRSYGRDATVQELALPRERIRALQEFLDWNLRPENRVYRYDYFRDNCSTRVRDALNLALDGMLTDRLRARTDITYRSEALALTGEDPLLTAGLDLGMGPLADQRLTRWELAFIPMRLRDALRDLSVSRDGRRIPLVASERHLPAASAPDQELAVPRGAVSLWTFWMFLAGLLVGGGFAALGRLARGGRDRREGRGSHAAGVALSVAGALWGLVTGVLGLILLGLWTMTDHEFAHANENLFQTSPLALLLVVLIPLAVARRGSRAASLTAGALAALSGLGLLLHPLPITPQANLSIIALALPIHLGVLHAVTTLQQEQPTGS